VWDIKYRPKKFADVLGQQGNVKLLKARLQKGTAFDTSYLFMGGHGQGKTTLGRIHARAMLCPNLNKEDPEPCNECESCIACLKDQSEAFSERDAASQGKIENVRAFVERLIYSVGDAKMRIELFDEAHRIGDGAQDVLLKPLEEKKFIGMFCTTEPNKIKGTIRSRCEEYVIRKVTREDILERAKMVCTEERVVFQDDALLTIIDSSGGHIRDIINKMEMVAQIGEINLTNTREYLHLSAVSLYYDILLSLDQPIKAIELIEQVCENVAPDEVVAGIAEAAMNSYRLANKMHTEFMLADREMGQKVWDRYREGTIRLADYFLNNRYASRASLMRDALLLTQLPGNMPPVGALPTLYIMPSGTAVPAGATPPPTAPPTTASPASPPPSTGQAVSAPTVANGVNGHGKFPMDPPLHDFGPPNWGTPSVYKPSVPVHREAHDDDRVLSPDDWRREFLRRLGRGAANG